MNNLEGIAERLGVLLPILVVELAVLVGIAFLYYLAVHAKAIRDELIAAKLFVAFWKTWPLVAVGLIFSVIVAAISLFQTGLRASATRSFAVAPFLLTGWIGIALGVWTYFTLRPAPPKEAASLIEFDRATGWPVTAAFSYGKRRDGLELANFIVVAVLGAAMAVYLVLSGAATLLAVIVPGALPSRVTATLFRSAADGPVEDGLLLLGLGILTGAGGTLLLRSAATKFMRERPLTVSERGIYAFYRGRRWRFLAWDQVNAISKLRIKGDRLTTASVGVEIKGTDVTLLITPKISDFSSLCRIISRHARENSISLLFVDKGRDTIRAQRDVIGSEEYRRIARTGLITEIAEL